MPSMRLMASPATPSGMIEPSPNCFSIWAMVFLRGPCSIALDFASALAAGRTAVASFFDMR
jgi:hypothetical protein